MQFVSNYENVYTRNYNRNCCLKNDDHFVTGGTGVCRDDKFRCPAGTSDYRVDIMLTLLYEKCLRRHTVEYLIIRDNSTPSLAPYT